MKKVDLVQENFSLDDNPMKILISSKLKGRALNWFHTKPEHLMLSVNELKEEMKTMYGQGPNKLFLRREFERRKWSPNEPFSDYHHDKVILANRVPIPDEETVDYIVDSIPDFRIRNQARMLCLKTSAELLKCIRKNYSTKKLRK